MSFFNLIVFWKDFIMNEFFNKMKYFEETEKVHQEIYYHYTSLNSLYEIIRNRTFWLTNLKTSNDKQELFYKTENFISDFTEIAEAENNEKTKTYFQLLLNSLNDNREFFNEAVNVKCEPYSLCLSNKRDNLTHWDRYAANSTGVCIAYNVAALKVYHSRMNSSIFGESIFDIGGVLYNKADISKYIRGVAIKMFAMIVEMKERSHDVNIQSTISKNGYMILATICLRIKKFIKNDSFIDENEVRFFHDATSIKTTLHLIDLMRNDLNSELFKNVRKNFLEIIKQYGIQENNFAMFQLSIRSYRKLCLNEIWGSGTIPEIVLGPRCLQDRIELKKFLKNNGLEGTKVSVSKIPIR